MHQRRVGLGVIMGLCLSPLLLPMVGNAAKGAVVAGQIQFQLRSTLVPSVGGHNPGYERSQPYWSLILKSEGSRYLVDKPFSVGGRKAPEFVQLAGIQLRPGAIVKMDGWVVPEKDFNVLADVKTVDLIMNPEWYCKTVGNTGQQFVSHISYSTQNNPELQHSEGHYQLRVEAIADYATYSIAQIDHALFKQVRGTTDDPSSNEWIFEGASGEADVSLSISQRPGQFESVPGVLRVKGRVQGSPSNLPHEVKQNPFSKVEIQMICNQ